MFLCYPHQKNYAFPLVLVQLQKRHFLLREHGEVFPNELSLSGL
jgi:hypothetical protein